MSELRRRMMMQQGGGVGYIQDGLVFWLDGIDKGASDGTWVDLIGGRIANPSNTGISLVSNSDSFERHGSTYKHFILDSTLYMPYDRYTLEVCFDIVGNDTNRTLIVGTTGTRPTKCLIWANNNIGYSRFGNNIYSYPDRYGIAPRGKFYKYAMPKTVSIGKDVCVSDCVKLSTYGDYGKSGAVSNCIIFGDNCDGKLYSIRVYNRILALEEMLHNQQIDNERFNLGLTI